MKWSVPSDDKTQDEVRMNKAEAQRLKSWELGGSRHFEDWEAT